MAKPAAAPTAATAMFWLHDMRAAAPVKAAVGAGEVKVPLDTGETTPVETGPTVGTWIWPSVIWVTGATEVGAWIWPSVIWVTGATTGAEVGAWIWPSVIWVIGAGTLVGA